MQRHKDPLSFAESPFDGARHCKSPVLAAQRPFLASSISADLLNTQWVLKPCHFIVYNWCVPG